MRVRELFAFIKERHQIYQRKARGEPKPWTKDVILQKYKFTNVYRELDKVTVWIRENWREPNKKDPNLFFAMTVARLLNWPDTLSTLGYPRTWDPAYFVSTLHELRKFNKIFGAAYIVSTNGRKMDKVEYLEAHVLTPLWMRRAAIRQAVATKSLATTHKALMETSGLGSFIAGQVVADLRYTPPLNQATDFDTWAASGPGSRRGLNRVLGRNVENPWREVDWLENLKEVGDCVEVEVRKAKMPPIHLQDLQNCLCEFDKYERTRLGQGRPKALYPGI